MTKYKNTLLLSALATLAAPIAFASPVFTITPAAKVILAQEGTPISIDYTVKNTSGLDQKQLTFTAPGSITAKDTCRSTTTLAIGASCTLSFSLDINKNEIIHIGKRDSDYPIKVCGFKGLGNNCSIPTEGHGTSAEFVPKFSLVGAEGKFDPPIIIHATVGQATKLDVTPRSSGEVPHAYVSQALYAQDKLWAFGIKGDPNKVDDDYQVPFLSNIDPDKGDNSDTSVPYPTDSTEGHIYSANVNNTGSRMVFVGAWSGYDPDYKLEPYIIYRENEEFTKVTAPLYAGCLLYTSPSPRD